jgi:ATP-dependent DNA helicase RecG
MPITKGELNEIIHHGENSGIEFKRDDLQNHELAKELVALTNLAGGMVLIGIEDHGEISGIKRENIEEWVMNACRDKIRPAIIPFFEMLKDVVPATATEKAKHIAVVRVVRGYDVHTLWHNNKNAYVIRVGSQSREATPEELARLFQQRGDFRAELRPLSGATLADLDLPRLTNYFRHIRGQEAPEEQDIDGWKSLLLNTELMVEDGVTLAALLLLGKNPNRFLPQAGITAVAYLGKEKDYSTRERLVIRGPITPLLDEKDHIIHKGIVEEAVAFIRRNSGSRGVLEEEGGRRQDKPLYPVEAVREAVVNSLVHRDYLLSGTDIEISLYEDRLEIISPGRLYNGITPQRMLAGCRASRNQLLKDVMRDYRYLEHVGMGVPRKIVKGMKEHNGTMPELIEDGESFMVRLWATAPDSK